MEGKISDISIKNNVEVKIMKKSKENKRIEKKDNKY